MTKSILVVYELVNPGCFNAVTSHKFRIIFKLLFTRSQLCEQILMFETEVVLVFYDCKKISILTKLECFHLLLYFLRFSRK